MSFGFVRDRVREIAMALGNTEPKVELIQVYEDAMNLKEPWVATDGEYFARGSTEEGARQQLLAERQLREIYAEVKRQNQERHGEKG